MQSPTSLAGLGAHILGALTAISPTAKGTPFNILAARGRHVRRTTPWYDHPSILALRKTVTGTSRPHRRWNEREMAKGRREFKDNGKGGGTLRYVRG